MKKLMTVVLAIIALTGCAGREYKEAQLRYYAAQAEMIKASAAQKATPLVSIEMGDDGKLKSLSVGRQDAGNQAQTMALPQDPTVEMVKTITSGIVTVGGIVATGRAASNLVEAVGGAVSKVSGPSTVTTTNTTTSTDNHAVTTTTDSHNVDSHNVDSTHIPTVVYQPAPVIVTP